MNVSDLLTAAKLHARIDHADDDPDMLLILSAAAGDVAHAAEYTLPPAAADLPDDIKLAIIDQAAMLFDARGGETDRPLGLSMAAARITARYRGVRLCLPPPATE
ncbi:phage gp6-like head-tail connector protein [Rhodobacter sp. SGA-6-6]|uniref:head-tail connector protein n=1 Tax=Rhodobacter sp. SGA-6-6 TaxID=2710882 RepID=UPI0013EA8F3D|nr:head-tail connector protein [Rhodobacter sp. SGA-6-6]NGM46400.1 phage gp6-like head-tail connector protein [Rhodobacter sp. SGA-6-6]